MWSGQQGIIFLTLVDIFRSAFLFLNAFFSDSGVNHIPRRRKEEVFAAYEVILSCSAACLGEISMWQLYGHTYVSGVVAITFYAIYFPLITTIAHLLAGVYHLLPSIHFLLTVSKLL